MSKGNLEKLLGGSFTALPGLNGEIEAEVNHEEPLPGINVPDRIFEKSFNGEALENLRKHAPKYKELIGRFDPFDYERMKTSAGTWSVLIEKPVITFKDTCEHALALCRLWVQEDKELAEAAQTKQTKEVSKEVAAKTNILIEGTKEYAVEQARLAWREAVRQRNEITKQWNEYVDTKRKEYHQLRDN